MTEAGTLGKKGAAQTQWLERYPRLPGITMLLSFACLMGILCLGAHLQHSIVKFPLISCVLVCF